VGPKTDVFKWWKENEAQFPDLVVPLAKPFHSISATSVGSQRLFSKKYQLIPRKSHSPQFHIGILSSYDI
jgi:hypothetical protein